VRPAPPRREWFARFAAHGLPVTLAGLVACDELRTGAPTVRPRPVEASEFSCEAGRCVQRHVRLPDDGEWRCAEEDGVAWCAGGEPAAGVVKAPVDRGFTCGWRRGPQPERVCVDEAPDHPGGQRGRYRCRFLQERGMKRECVEESVPVRAVVARGAPDCWLDRDCVPGTCDRGRCTRGSP
jgi:hypothetical protein